MRNYKRLRFDVKVEVTYYEDKNKEIVSKLRTENVSAGGVRLTVPNKFEKGALLFVKLSMPYTGEEISTFAQVTWVRPRNEGGFVIGLTFTGLSDKETEKIDQFIESEMDKGFE